MGALEAAVTVGILAPVTRARGGSLLTLNARWPPGREALPLVELLAPLGVNGVETRVTVVLLAVVAPVCRKLVALHTGQGRGRLFLQQAERVCAQLVGARRHNDTSSRGKQGPASVSQPASPGCQRKGRDGYSASNTSQAAAWLHTLRRVP